MIPIKDDNPTRGVPWLTLALIAANGWTYLWEASVSGSLFAPLASQVGRAAVEPLSLIPARFAALEGGPPAWPVAGPLVPVLTSMFLHADLMHLLGNMLYLWIFGNNVEDVMGHARFACFYLLCGGVAALSQVLADLRSPLPMVGASGAVAGVLGAYLVRFPRAGVLVLVWLLFFLRVVRVPALVVLGVWFIYQLASAGGNGPGVAWYAHIGGFVAGALMLHLFARGPRRRRI
jgi:membrane associated rhomboid family serine protease